MNNQPPTAHEMMEAIHLLKRYRQAEKIAMEYEPYWLSMAAHHCFSEAAYELENHIRNVDGWFIRSALRNKIECPDLE